MPLRLRSSTKQEKRLQQAGPVQLMPLLLPRRLPSLLARTPASLLLLLSHDCGARLRGTGRALCRTAEVGGGDSLDVHTRRELLRGDRGGEGYGLLPAFSLLRLSYRASRHMCFISGVHKGWPSASGAMEFQRVHRVAQMTFSVSGLYSLLRLRLRLRERDREAEEHAVDLAVHPLLWLLSDLWHLAVMPVVPNADLYARKNPCGSHWLRRMTLRLERMGRATAGLREAGELAALDLVAFCGGLDPAMPHGVPGGPGGGHRGNAHPRCMMDQAGGNHGNHGNHSLAAWLQWLQLQKTQTTNQYN